MKKIITVLFLSLLILVMAVAVNAALLSPGLNNIAEEYSLTLSALDGESFYFTSDHFSEAVGVSEFNEIRITSLPDEKSGTLYFGDTVVCHGQVIKENKLELLRFEPKKGIESTNFSFTFDEAYSMTCNLLYSDKTNNAPTAISIIELCGYTSSVSVGEMKGYDADGDKIRYEIVEYPKHGRIVFDSKTGEFSYTAGTKALSDSFTYRVKDSLGAYSEVCKCTVNVKKNDRDGMFTDIEFANSVTAAKMMTDSGYMSYDEVGGKNYFNPDDIVTRLDFLVTCMNVFGASNVPKVDFCGFADDDEVPVKYKGYVYSAAKLGIVDGVSNNGDKCFMPNEHVTKAQAAIILNNIIGYSAEEVKSLAGVPDWASDAVCAMYELGIYDLNGGKAECSYSLTKGEASEWLYRVNLLFNE